jgi:hypothetical protein
MLNLQAYPATVAINGRTIGNSISAGIMKGNWLYARVENTSYSFGFFPFPPEIITRWSQGYSTQNPRSLSFSGESLGFSSWGPSGPDGDGETRTNTNLSLSISYGRTEVHLVFNVIASHGQNLYKGQAEGEPSPALPEWHVALEFSVPKDSIVKFLSVTEADLAEFIEALSLCPREGSNDNAA